MAVRNAIKSVVQVKCIYVSASVIYLVQQGFVSSEWATILTKRFKITIHHRGLLYIIVSLRYSLLYEVTFLPAYTRK